MILPFLSMDNSPFLASATIKFPALSKSNPNGRPLVSAKTPIISPLDLKRIIFPSSNPPYIIPC